MKAEKKNAVCSAGKHGAKAEILHMLGERVKELTALHSTARILQNDEQPIEKAFNRVLQLLPPAWQYPDITEARIKFDGMEFHTDGFAKSPWSQHAVFKTAYGRKGLLEIRYMKKMPQEAEGPFLAEERNLINSIAEMLCSYAERVAARRALIRARDELELRVVQRTAELERLNQTLLDEIRERKDKERKIRAYQSKLKSMTSEMAISEERERRDIAAELHERIGHTLAYLKMRLSGVSLSPDNELISLVDSAIRSTRGLTFELGSPVLYELGFEAAVESLAEQFQEKQKIDTDVIRVPKDVRNTMPEEVKLLLFKAVRELLHNVAKHSCAEKAVIRIERTGRKLAVSVKDNGNGFVLNKKNRSAGFGLFSIKERLGRFGGTIAIRSVPGKGSEVTLIVPVS